MRSGPLLGLGVRSTLITVHSFGLARFVKSSCRSWSTDALGLVVRVYHLHRLAGGREVRNVPRRLLVLPLTVEVLAKNPDGVARALVLLHLLRLCHEPFLGTLRFLLTKLVFELNTD